MNTLFKQLLIGTVLAWMVLQPPSATSQETPEAVTPPEASIPAAEPSGSEPVAMTPQEDPPVPSPQRPRRSNRGNGAIVSFAGDAVLPEGESTEAVVAILGSAISSGTVFDSVVAILGDVRVSGSVGESVVAILGDVYVDGRVDDAVVVVLGNIELGPNADIRNDVVVVGGTLTRAASAEIGGQVQDVASNVGNIDWTSSFGWARAWIEHCLMKARPLALAPDLGWAWAIALGFLAFYVAVALLFSSSVDRCVATMETYPGRSLLAALLGVLLTPIVFLMLVITVVGIVIVPFLAMAFFFAGLFGKMVMLAWLGRRGTRLFGDGPWNHAAIAVLLGGVIVLGLYLVPVLGFIVYKTLGIIGFGVVLYTLLLAWQAAHPPVSPVAATSGTMGVEMATEPQSTFQTDNGERATDISALSLPRAGFWIRMVALAIDALLVGTLLVLIGSSGSMQLLVLAAYGAVMWKLKATTIGGIVCDLKVVRLDGRPIDWSIAIVRALSCFLSLAVAGLGFIWVAFDSQKQSWHDKIAGTTIVRVPKGVSLL